MIFYGKRFTNVLSWPSSYPSPKHSACHSQFLQYSLCGFGFFTLHSQPGTFRMSTQPQPVDNDHLHFYTIRNCAPLRCSEIMIVKRHLFIIFLFAPKIVVWESFNSLIVLYDMILKTKLFFFITLIFVNYSKHTFFLVWHSEFTKWSRGVSFMISGFFTYLNKHQIIFSTEILEDHQWIS
jgi:hypothetical protein